MKVLLTGLVCMFFFFPRQVQAETGCIASGIALQTNGTMYTSYKSGYYDLYGAKTTSPYSTYCIVTTNSACIVKGLGSYQGTEVYYSPLPCDIDSEIIFLLSSITVFGFFKLKKLMLT